MQDQVFRHRIHKSCHVCTNKDDSCLRRRHTPSSGLRCKVSWLVVHVSTKSNRSQPSCKCKTRHLMWQDHHRGCLRPLCRLRVFWRPSCAQRRQSSDGISICTACSSRAFICLHMHTAQHAHTGRIGQGGPRARTIPCRISSPATASPLALLRLAGCRLGLHVPPRLRLGGRPATMLPHQCTFPISNDPSCAIPV